MNLLIFGATGGTGRALVEQALAQGHVVTAFARNSAKLTATHDNLRKVKGDILKYDSVESAMRGQDAVLSALGIRVRVLSFIAVIIICQAVARFSGFVGPVGWLVRIGIPLLSTLVIYGRTTTLSKGTKNIIDAMEKLGVRRFVCQSSLGIGDSKGRLGVLYNFVLIPLMLRNIFRDKELQEKLIRESTLDWIIVRPSRLTNGPQRATYNHGPNVGSEFITLSVSRVDVAEFMLRQVGGDAYLRKTPGLAY